MTSKQDSLEIKVVNSSNMAHIVRHIGKTCIFTKSSTGQRSDHKTYQR